MLVALLSDVREARALRVTKGSPVSSEVPVIPRVSLTLAVGKETLLPLEQGE